MAIGTKVKVGMDASAVQAGIGKMTGMFKGLGRTVGRVGRQVAIGGARQAGMTIFGLAMRAGQAIPREISRLADYSAELQHVARDTKVVTSELIAMHKAMELSGMDADMAADAFRELLTKVGEATRDWESEPAKALRELGVFQTDLKGKSANEQMNTLAQAIQDFGGNQNQIMDIMDRFMGGDIGQKTVGFFQDYNDVMEEGRRLTAGFSKQLEASTDGLQDVIRLRAVVAQKFSEFALGAFGVARGRTGGLIEKLERMDLAAKGEAFARKIRDTFTWIRESGGLMAMFKETMTWLREEMHGLGEKFGEGIKASIGGNGGLLDAINPFSGMGKGKDKSTATLDGINQNTKRTNQLLDRISRDGGAVFA